jgi:hypothetical protein
VHLKTGRMHNTTTIAEEPGMPNSSRALCSVCRDRWVQPLAEIPPDADKGLRERLDANRNRRARSYAGRLLSAEDPHVAAHRLLHTRRGMTSDELKRVEKDLRDSRLDLADRAVEEGVCLPCTLRLWREKLDPWETIPRP